MTVKVNTQGGGTKAAPLPAKIDVSLTSDQWRLIIDLMGRGCDICDCFDDPTVNSLTDQVYASNTALNTP